MRNQAAYVEGIKVMDMDGGAGWDLADKLIHVEPGSRLTAAAALAHPFVTRVALLSSLSLALNSITGGTALLPPPVRSGTRWLGDQMVKSGTEAGGGLTEAYLDTMKAGGRPADEAPLEDAPSQTVAQWELRQKLLGTKRK